MQGIALLLKLWQINYCRDSMKSKMQQEQNILRSYKFSEFGLTTERSSVCLKRFCPVAALKLYPKSTY